MRLLTIILLTMSVVACGDNLFSNSHHHKGDATALQAVNIGDLLDENSDLNLPPDVLETVACQDSSGNDGISVCLFPQAAGGDLQTLCLTLQDLEDELGQGESCDDSDAEAHAMGWFSHDDDDDVADDDDDDNHSCGCNSNQLDGELHLGRCEDIF